MSTSANFSEETNINDFGFTFEDDADGRLANAEKVATEAATSLAEANALIDTLRKLNRETYGRIARLCNNLKVEPDKKNLHWPNRVEAVNKFLEELNHLRVTRDPNDPERQTVKIEYPGTH
mgnify:CR=1 FL=1